MSKPATATIAQLHYSGKPAPRDDHGNPIIHIDLDTKACEAQETERAHTKSVQGKVIFEADGSDILYFSNKQVFNKSSVQLKNGKVNLEVQIDSGRTDYCITPFPHQHDGKLGDPKLVIP